ncbi:hypothetical protein F383_32573 [Gossypium arboreum]|uniref:Uncharacterized protein n=1 Tax=Gossypium arboreum TaxID=29729 RepID=A0A0B0PLT4_GOSAR|nr:hypothetical protein F383_32573 [Gossypium arboreum]
MRSTDYPSGLNPFCNTCRTSLHMSIMVYLSNSLFNLNRDIYHNSYLNHAFINHIIRHIEYLL